MSHLYPAHLESLLNNYGKAFSDLQKSLPGLQSLLIHSGSEQIYYGDDRAVPFQAYGHFCHWLPVNRPDQMLLISPGERPKYFQVIPPDFWYEQSIDNQSWWADHWDIVPLRQGSEIAAHLGATAGVGFIGANHDFAKALGLQAGLVNPESLLHYLDFLRAYKTAYEVEQLRTANAQALRGHQAAQESFHNGGSEYDIHMAFLLSCQQLEEESPYTNIVALDEKSATLHYQYKRRNSGDRSGKQSQVLLMDAGCRVNGYCSDVTRTSVRPHTLTIFQSLLKSMDALQQRLVQLVKPGLDYQALHNAALAGVGQILLDHDIVRGSHDFVMKQRMPALWFPHGVGHLLGIQVHDVGGKQQNRQGTTRDAPADAPALRNTRVMDQHMVFTVEPGMYFIPSLLDPERNSVRGKAINWTLVDELTPLGGIRIEDNVLVTATGVDNLTRG